MTLNWAIHRLNGISSPASAVYTAEELAHQLRDSGAKCLFTVQPLLETAAAAAQKAGIPRARVYICRLNDPATDGAINASGHTTLEHLIAQGYSLPELEPCKWSPGQGATQTAFLCYSSGTSGLPVSRAAVFVGPAR